MSFHLRSFRFLLYIAMFWLTPSYADLATDTIYTTWQKNPTTTMTVQWITRPGQHETLISYHPLQDPEGWQQLKGEWFKFPYSSQYIIHRVEINDLKPNTRYVFRVSPYKEEYRFHTLPEQIDEKGLRFVVGGDMYHDGLEFLAKTSRQAALTSPDFALIGGDIAYAVGTPPRFQKIDRWIEWIKSWHANMVTPQGDLVPVLAAVGNHDVIGQYYQTPNEAAVFSALFPMPGKQIYNVMDFGNYLSVVFLDTAHANPINGKQTAWLKETLESRKNIPNRFAIYHVPAYPSVRGYFNKESVQIRRFWVPLFENGGIQTAFEHHDHAYKRTHPILKNGINQDGVVYLGDGGWGVEKPRTMRRKNYKSYLAKFASARHFISVTLTPEKQQYKSITDEGIVIDEYSRQLSPVKILQPAGA